MSTLKAIFTIALTLVTVSFAGITKADNLSGNKTADLNLQIVDEIKGTLQTPYLKYASDNLDGEITVIARVSKNGKIEFKYSQGINERLRSSIEAELNSLNLWTSPDYSNKEFKYRIKYRN